MFRGNFWKEPVKAITRALQPRVTQTDYVQQPQQQNIEEWSCSICTFANEMDINQCIICVNSRSVWKCPHCTTINAIHTDKVCTMCRRVNSNRYWKCNQCTFINDKEDKDCTVCTQHIQQIEWYFVQSQIRLNDFIKPLNDMNIYTIDDFKNMYKGKHTLFKKELIPHLEQILKRRIKLGEERRLRGICQSYKEYALHCIKYDTNLTESIVALQTSDDGLLASKRPTQDTVFDFNPCEYVRKINDIGVPVTDCNSNRIETMQDVTEGENDHIMCTQHAQHTQHAQPTQPIQHISLLRDSSKIAQPSSNSALSSTLPSVVPITQYKDEDIAEDNSEENGNENVNINMPNHIKNIEGDDPLIDIYTCTSDNQIEGVGLKDDTLETALDEEIMLEIQQMVDDETMEFKHIHNLESTRDMSQPNVTDEESLYSYGTSSASFSEDGLHSIPNAVDNDINTETLQEILKQHRENLITTDHRLAELKQQLLSLSSDQTDTNYNNILNNNGNDKYNGNQSNFSNRNNANNKDGNNSDDNKRNYRENGNNDNNGICCEMHDHCNHLNECTQCAHILQQKYEQIKLFKSLIVTLQQQHEYHVSFENMIFKAINNNTKKKGNKSKSKPFQQIIDVPMNKPRYDPIYGAKGNIKISKTLSQDIIPNIIKEPISNVYSYLDKSIGMQYNDGQITDEDDNKMLDNKYRIINCDFHDKISTEPLYCVMERRSDSTKNNKCKWQIQDKLFKTMELTSFTLPQSSRMSLQKRAAIHDICQFTFNEQSVESIIKHCQWRMIPVFNRKNNKKRMILAITKEQLNPIITRYLLNINNHKHRLKQILMFDNESHWIEYILIVNIERDIDIAVSLRHTKQKGVHITGIHLDKEMILKQHEVVSKHYNDECHCLDDFSSVIDDIRIGNPDVLSNQIKNYKQRHHAFKQLILKFINGKDTEKYEILQFHAEMAIKNDNGSLGYCLYPLTSLPSPSIKSSVSSYSYGSVSNRYTLQSAESSVSSNSDSNPVNERSPTILFN